MNYLLAILAVPVFCVSVLLIACGVLRIMGYKKGSDEATAAGWVIIFVLILAAGIVVSVVRS